MQRDVTLTESWGPFMELAVVLCAANIASHREKCGQFITYVIVLVPSSSYPHSSISQGR